MNRAAEILERLRGLGHGYNPDKQRFKADLEGERVTVYAPDGRAHETAAAEIENYIDKGFVCEPPTPASEPLNFPVFGEQDSPHPALEQSPKAEVVSLAEAMGLDSSGTKVEIIARIRSAAEAAAAANGGDPAVSA